MKKANAMELLRPILAVNFPSSDKKPGDCRLISPDRFMSLLFK